MCIRDRIRNNTTEVAPFIELHGNTLYSSQDGCPIAGCTGYELTQDLNFDTNENGQFDEGDSYWNEGKGWQPIGSFYVKFKN